jgi:predicted RNase H-like nuclease (RuvC/YqgF family)
MPEAAWGAIGTIFGGVLLALVGYFRETRKDKMDEGYQIRQEQREDLKTLKEEMTEMRKEMKQISEESEQWRSKYQEVSELKDALENKCAELQKKYNQVIKELHEFKEHQVKVNETQKLLNETSNEIH